MGGDGVGDRDGNDFDHEKYESPASNVRLNTGDKQINNKRRKN